jgi:hypothetical protein
VSNNCAQRLRLCAVVKLKLLKMSTDTNKIKETNGAKPFVSGSLPGWAVELFTEVRFRLLVDIDQDGEPRSSMAELLEMWDKVNKALDIKTIGQ